MLVHDDWYREWPQLIGKSMILLTNLLFQMSGMFLDSPSTTSQVTYKIQILSEQSGNTGAVFLNRSQADTDINQQGRYASSITVQEIAG
jgi:hypothetical protein